MKTIDYDRYEQEFIWEAPAATRYNPQKVYGDPNTTYRYRYVSVIGGHTDGQLAVEINSLLTHKQAGVLWKAMRGEASPQELGLWGLSKFDIGAYLGDEAVENMELRNCLISILSSYVYGINGLPEDYKVGVCCDRDALRTDLEEVKRLGHEPKVSLLIRLLLAETNAISFYRDSLEIWDEPFDENDYLLEHENFQPEQALEDYKKLVNILHPEVVFED